MSNADGTERLCQALYARPATPRDYLGGSESQMLYDAADRIVELRALVTELRKAVGDQNADMATLGEEVLALQADVARRRVICNRCAQPVEVERFCYAVPVCYACLPPPPPLQYIDEDDDAYALRLQGHEDGDGSA